MITHKTSGCTLHVSFHPVCACSTLIIPIIPILDCPRGCGGLLGWNAARNIYSWSNYTPLGKVRVVMIGQDPYHGPGQAHGTRNRAPLPSPSPPMQPVLTAFFFFFIDPPPFAPGCPAGLCFSVPHGVPAPPSLKNVSLPYLYPFYTLPRTRHPLSYDSCHSFVVGAP